MTNEPPRTPQQIIDALAQRRGVVTPVPSYFPLGPAFARQCVREAYGDAIDLLESVVGQPQLSAETVRELHAAIHTLKSRLDKQ